ncbi:ABC transporter permease [Clostridium sp. AF18-27]|jgi:ABC-2 type transport system permease protein|uniref:ABC-2 family transporter protein n=2 Tax=Enterocloster lavalensis TaxID=460384 RepID=A0A1I0K2L1_9FIRM|nr:MULTISPECIES: ABC transporter permease subunit [Enterocloster]MBS5604773.1 ABC transporter permease subunit [Enterocloster asparagiformis]RHR54351.1 ABC transporter permease [Clostridium sp. AF18-27]MDR3757651.1 ABC transporter permease subunit [Enterocloster sp.]PST31739.1 ABC transporter permease [Enterocloster lavalensis]SEU17866.1 ABC-2 family transporter protein [Enterocloster lavalensis]
MKQNPVYKRETRVNSRSLRLPLILTVFNGILCAVALMNMYSVVSQVKATATIQYSSFMEMYEFVATIEFILLTFIVPAVTASSISGERERQTLELMLTTQMTPAQIVNGKLMSALSTLLLLIISSFPAIMMVFVFGGITPIDVVALLLCYTAVALFAGSLGICFSSAFKRSTLSTVLTYGVLVSIVGGTYFVNRFVLGLSAGRINSYAITYGIGRAQQQPTSGNFVYLLLMNPAATFYAIISGQAGSGSGVDKLCKAFGIVQKGWVMENWVLISIVLQLAVAACLLALAIWFVNPIRRRRKKRG